MVISFIAGLLLVGCCAVLMARAVALPRLRARDSVEQIAAYGFHPQDEAPAATAGPLHGTVERVAKLLGASFAGRLKGLSEPEMRRELMQAGMYRMQPVTLIGYRILACTGLPLVFLWFGAGHFGAAGAVVLFPVMVVVGWLLPLTFVRRRARQRLERIDDDLPQLVDLLVVTVESGTGLSGSLQIAAQRFSGPLGDELRLALQEQSMGLSTDQALANILERSQSDGLRSFVRSIRQGESLGVSIGQIMRGLADEMRQRQKARAEERAQKAPVKILFPLIALIFPAIFVVVLAPAMLSLMDTLGGGGG
jgi:tight adherence protein C